MHFEENMKADALYCNILGYEFLRHVDFVMGTTVELRPRGWVCEVANAAAREAQTQHQLNLALQCHKESPAKKPRNSE